MVISYQHGNPIYECLHLITMLIAQAAVLRIGSQNPHLPDKLRPGGTPG